MYNLRAATTWHHSLPRSGTCPLKYTYTHRVPTLVAPLASSQWNLPTQAFAHPLCVPTPHTLIGILKLAVCPLVAPFKTYLDHIR